jgi:hypothetical protein
MQQYAHISPDQSKPTWQGPRADIRISGHPRASLLTDDQLAALHVYPADLAEIPEGARITSESWAIVNGRAVQSVIEYQTAEQLEAEAEAQRQTERQAQTAQDIQSYGTLIGELATILAQFPGITQDMGYNDISDVMAAAAFGDASESERARLHALSSRADNLYARLQKAPDGGITGARLWRAVDALQGGGQ